LRRTEVGLRTQHGFEFSHLVRGLDGCTARRERHSQLELDPRARRGRHTRGEGVLASIDVDDFIQTSNLLAEVGRGEHASTVEIEASSSNTARPLLEVPRDHAQAPGYWCRKREDLRLGHSAPPLNDQRA
jgi:hypothetical protein